MSSDFAYFWQKHAPGNLNDNFIKEHNKRV